MQNTWLPTPRGFEARLDPEWRKLTSTRADVSSLFISTIQKRASNMHSHQVLAWDNPVSQRLFHHRTYYLCSLFSSIDCRLTSSFPIRSCRCCYRVNEKVPRAECRGTVNRLYCSACQLGRLIHFRLRCCLSPTVPLTIRRRKSLELEVRRARRHGRRATTTTAKCRSS